MRSKVLTRIIELIKDLDLTYRYVEGESGITEGYISKADRMERSISAERLGEIYKTLKVHSDKKINPEWILTGSGQRYFGYKPDNTLLKSVKEEEVSYSFKQEFLKALNEPDIIKEIERIMTQK